MGIGEAVESDFDDIRGAQARSPGPSAARGCGREHADRADTKDRIVLGDTP